VVLGRSVDAPMAMRVGSLPAGVSELDASGSVVAGVTLWLSMTIGSCKLDYKVMLSRVSVTPAEKTQAQTSNM
jgi:hypothetical protein